LPTQNRDNANPCAPGRRLNVCIVAHFAYPTLAGGSGGHIGGVERQTSMMARWFAAHGHRVSMVTWDEGQADGVEIDGVRVFKVCRPEQGVRGLRFLHPRWTSLNGALRRADAEVYYHNCGEYFTGQIALWCRLHGRKFVYSAASDADCDARLPLLPKLRERILYRFGIGRADQIIVQTQTQHRMLREGFGREATVIPMPCAGPPEGMVADRERPAAGSRRVLWVGRICEVKRPDRFCDLAEALPELQFDLVGPADGSVYASRIMARASRIPNITVHGPLPGERVANLYRRAACLCSTSVVEGFPNTFLEAWSHGLPVVTTFDPDRVVGERKLGTVAADVPGLARAIRELLGSADGWRAASANGRRYYLENHAVERVMPLFEQALLDVAGSPPRASAGMPTVEAVPVANGIGSEGR
jgi:glycosyltransferase involved in cell wall biosynthesis